jgi:hypothetical protein
LRRGVIRLGDQIKDIWFRDITNRIPPVSSASYIVFTDGSKYYAKNGDSGVIEFTDIDISNLLQNVINALYQRYGGGRVFIKRGIYYPSKTINIPDGIKLVIEGEGDATVFKYTSSFTLFYHKPSSPTWSSILVFRNFKIDRSGSGSNQANDIYILYAFYDEYDNITIVDDYREVAEDVGLYGRNSIVSVVHNCRFFNKASPVWFHSFLVHIYSNYARNTSLIGFGAGHLLPESVFGYKQPPGYPLDGLVVIEGNVCVDCGRADEAYAVDNESDNPYTYGAGIIRNNMLITQNYSVMNVGLICGNTDKCFIEDNIVNITAQNNVINVWWKSARPSLAVIRGNKVTATVQKNNIPFIVSADRAVIENNDINITVTADGSDTSSINWGMKLEALSLVFARNRVVYSYPNASYNQPYFVHMNGYMNQVVFRDNYINVLYPSNIFTSYGVTLEDIVNKNAEFVIVENNDINFSAGGPLTIGFWGSYSIPPLLKIVGNRFYSGSSSVNILIGLRANNTVKAIVLHNAFEGGVSGLSLYTDSGLTPTLIFLDRDAPIALISTGITTKYTKRNSGVATIPAGSTRVTVNHNLVASPSKLQITPLGQPPGKLWVENITNTSFDIVTDTAPASNLNVSWYAEV